MAQVLPLSILNSTLGALEAGCMAACFLMGIVTIQVYNYYSRFQNDPSLIKYMVAFVWLCELGHSICITHAVYIMTVVSWSNPAVLNDPPKSLSTAIFFSALSTPLIQSFLAWRIKGVANTWIITVVCWVLSLVRSVMALISFVEGVKMENLEQYLHDWQWAILATIVVGSANDILIALSLTWTLLRERRRTKVKSTITVIDTLISWSLQTGLLTSMSGVVMMVLFLVMPHNYIWLCVFTLLAKLYSNSLMAVLNGRSSLRGKHTVVELYPSTTGRLGGTSSLDMGSTRIQRSIESDIAFGDNGKRTETTDPESSIGSVGTKSTLVKE